MNHELKRNLLIKYYTKNIGGVFFLTFASILLTYLWKPSANMYNYFLGLFTMLFATFITWVGHWSMHNYNKYNPIAKLHAITHHSPFAHTFLGKLIEYCIIEFIFFGGGILLAITLLIKNKFNMWILDPYILLFWAIAVPFIHEVHYHQLEMSDYHELHHKDHTKLYSPELYDIIFDKKYDDTDFVEDETKMVPVILILLIINISVIGTKYDVIKWFSK